MVLLLYNCYKKNYIMINDHEVICMATRLLYFNKMTARHLPKIKSEMNFKYNLLFGTHNIISFRLIKIVSSNNNYL